MSDLWWLKHDPWLRQQAKAQGIQVPEAPDLVEVLTDPKTVLGRKFRRPYIPGGRTEPFRLIDVSLPYPVVFTIGLRAELFGESPSTARAIFTIGSGAQGALDERTVTFGPTVGDRFRRYLAVIGHKLQVDCTLEFTGGAVGTPPESVVSGYAAIGDSALAIESVVGTTAPVAADQNLNLRLTSSGAGTHQNVVPVVDPRRVGLTFYNDSPAPADIVRVNLDPSDPTATNWTVTLLPGDYYETPTGQRYPNRASVFFDTADGVVNVTQLRSSELGL